MTRLHFGVNFGIERSIGWEWSIRVNAGCHEHRRSKFALMNIQISKCDPYQEKFLLTERVKTTCLLLYAGFVNRWVVCSFLIGDHLCNIVYCWTCFFFHALKPFMSAGRIL